MHRHQRQTQAKHPAGNTRHADEPGERVSMATLSPASLPALQRTIGNAAVARMVTDRQNDDLAVQRAPSDNGETASQQSAQTTYEFAEVKGANPGLYTNGTNYWIGTDNPPEGYFFVEQHCAYMSAYWLMHGHGADGLRFADLEESVRIQAAATVRAWTAGGLAMQVTYARDTIGGREVRLEDLDSDVAAGSLPPGTLIWFGNDQHVEAAVVTASGQYLKYDPNRGETTSLDPNGFRSYIATKNVFVVKAGKGADPRTCKCCVVM